MNRSITTYLEAIEVAHLVPSACVAWFDRNRMYRYCSNRIPSGGRSATDDDRNGILLRRDLHWLLDTTRFVFVPGTAAELMHLYHNLALQPLRSVAVPLLFAHFALSIFKE
ncbi:hypothetical protein DL764_006220 [Monosporascus ibericus]|uniref:HNH nuclease domain-containing protein n=1 Tax=Monosporascus ibericus TaxID=155417 RepID=A0A4Q4T7F4_9PEZI|nr:hypothetical protein DL764_006220 [Monosporascus ibericus]